MKFSVVPLLLLYAIGAWETISCNGSQKIGLDGAEIEIYSLIPSNPRFLSRRLLETKNTNGKLGLKEREVKRQESEEVETAAVEEKEKENSETEEDSSEMESSLILPEATNDSEPEIMESQKKARETEQQVEQIEEQDAVPMVEKKEQREEKRIPEKIKLKSDIREQIPDLEAIEKEGRAETKVESSSNLEADQKRDSELAVDQKVLDEDVEALTNMKKVEKTVKLQKERESERQKQGGEKNKKGTEVINVQGSSFERSKESDLIIEDSRGKKMQHEPDSESHFERKDIESESVSLPFEGSEDGTISDVAGKLKAGGKKVSDSLSESELMEEKRWEDITKVKPQKTAENKASLETPRNSEKGSAQLNPKTIKEKKPHKEKGRKTSKVETPVVDESIKLKVLKSDHIILDVPTNTKKGGKKSLDSTSKSELVEGVQGFNNRAETKRENEAEETLDAEKKEKETLRKSTGELSRASHDKTKERSFGMEMEGEETSEVELQILSEGNELRDTDTGDEMADAVTKAKKETEQVLDSESESELVKVVGWDDKVKQKQEDRTEETFNLESIQVETHKNAEINVKKLDKAQTGELKGTEREETSNVDEDVSEEAPLKKIQETEPQEKISAEDKSEVDLQANKEEKAVGDLDANSKKGQQSGITKGTNRSSAQDSDDDDDDEEYVDFMQDFSDLPSKFQDTAQKLAGHLGPNIQKITDTSKVYFNKANQQITESFSPLVGKQYAPFLASLISYGLLLLPLAVVIIVFENIRALLSLQKVLLFVNIYLAAYFATLLLATFIIESEPMTFFFKNSTSGYLHLQLLQALGYIAYLTLLTFDVIGSCSSEALSVKVMALLQWFVAVLIGLHYYVTVFHRAMGMKVPHTSWKIYGMYSVAFSILSLFARITRIKKGYSPLGDVNTDKKN